MEKYDKEGKLFGVIITTLTIDSMMSTEALETCLQSAFRVGHYFCTDTQVADDVAKGR